ncbi:MAG: hypothetical protein VZQ75_07510 [Candidatus Faecousia sp.]|nr:hypothetical protein [Candidatus Faecousia sp.]
MRPQSGASVWSSTARSWTGPIIPALRHLPTVVELPNELKIDS